MYNDRVLEDVLFISNFKILDGKYYLAYVEYHNMGSFLYFYYGVCYHFKKQVIIGKKLVNKEKLFNLYHLSLCNVVRRIFEVTKWCFQIFKSVLEYCYNI